MLEKILFLFVNIGFAFGVLVAATSSVFDKERGVVFHNQMITGIALMVAVIGIWLFYITRPQETKAEVPRTGADGTHAGVEEEE